MRGVEEQDPAQTGTHAVEVWWCHMDAVQVFGRCQQTIAAGGMSLVWLGLTAVEVRAALAVSRMPRDRWGELADDVQTMGRAAAEYLNRRAEKAANARR